MYRIKRMVTSNIRTGANTSNPHSVHDDTSIFSAYSGGLSQQYKGEVVDISEDDRGHYGFVEFYGKDGRVHRAPKAHKQGRTRENFKSGAVHGFVRGNEANDQAFGVHSTRSIHKGQIAFRGSGARPNDEVQGCGKSAVKSINTDLQHGAINSNFAKHAAATAPPVGDFVKHQYGLDGTSTDECLENREQDHHGVSSQGVSAKRYENAAKEHFNFRQPPRRAPAAQTRENFRQPPKTNERFTNRCARK